MGWKVKTFTFFYCRLGDSLSDKLSLINFSNIRKLQVISDRFGNKGLTKLFKMSLPSLEIFAFGNTEITNDALKVLQKNMSKLKFIGYSNQSNINSLLFMRSAIQAYRLPNRAPNRLTIKLYLNMFQLGSYKNFMIYYPQIAKCKCL